jgi:hypothetical protein
MTEPYEITKAFTVIPPIIIKVKDEPKLFIVDKESNDRSGRRVFEYRENTPTGSIRKTVLVHNLPFDHLYIFNETPHHSLSLSAIHSGLTFRVADVTFIINKSNLHLEPNDRIVAIDFFAPELGIERTYYATERRAADKVGEITDAIVSLLTSINGAFWEDAMTWNWRFVNR